MNYAIISLGGKQYRVSEGETLVVDKLAEEQIDKKGVVSVTDVLFVRDGKDIKVGTPLVEGAVVTLQHEQNQKGEKLRVFKYKSKSRYRRTQGHRQHESVFTVKKIAA